MSMHSAQPPNAIDDGLIQTHVPGYRARRGLNWAFLGLLYTSYYMCRYNFSIANKSISDQYGFSKTAMGGIITTNLLAYACGQIVNGLLTDRMGGKRAMLIGAAGTVAMNLLFGAASFAGMFSLFVLLWGMNGYLQSFGAPGMVKINTAWFRRRERGRFAGIFGFMINLGRFGIFKLGPALLGGFMVLGMFKVGPLHWRWLFWAPAMICAVVAVGMAIFVKETPEEAGFSGEHLSDEVEPVVDKDVRADFGAVLRIILSNPAVWVVALAYACTGAVRQAIDVWFPRYMQDMYNAKLDSAQFQWLAFLIPFVASVGSLASGYISDTIFKGSRAPVAAALYLFETAIILAAAQFHSANSAVVFFVLISLTANSTHSILGTAAAMDIGGRKMSGFSSGLIDSFQYFGGSLAGLALGRLLDVNMGSYFYFMAPFGVIGGVLMILGKDIIKPKPLARPGAFPVITNAPLR